MWRPWESDMIKPWVICRQPLISWLSLCSSLFQGKCHRYNCNVYNILMSLELYCKSMLFYSNRLIIYSFLSRTSYFGSVFGFCYFRPVFLVSPHHCRAFRHFSWVDNTGRDRFSPMRVWILNSLHCITFLAMCHIVPSLKSNNHCILYRLQMCWKGRVLQIMKTPETILRSTNFEPGTTQWAQTVVLLTGYQWPADRADSALVSSFWIRISSVKLQTTNHFLIIICTKRLEHCRFDNLNVISRVLVLRNSKILLTLVLFFPKLISPKFGFSMLNHKSHHY